MNSEVHPDFFAAKFRKPTPWKPSVYNRKFRFSSYWEFGNQATTCCYCCRRKDCRRSECRNPATGFRNLDWKQVGGKGGRKNRGGRKDRGRRNEGWKSGRSEGTGTGRTGTEKMNEAENRLLKKSANFSSNLVWGIAMEYRREYSQPIFCADDFWEVWWGKSRAFIGSSWIVNVFDASLSSKVRALQKENERIW